MPWDIKKDDRCPVAKPWGVVKQGHGSLEGCHESEDQAKQQQAALYANEGRAAELEQAARSAEAALIAEGFNEGDPRKRPPRDNLVRSMLTTEFRAAADGENADGRLGTLVGRMANFNVWGEVRSAVEGHFMERVAPGSFTKTFAENRSRMQIIFDHGQHKTIGRLPLGPLEAITEDARAIDYQGALIDTSYNRDLLPGLRANLYGSSYRFDTIRDAWKVRPGRSEANPEGIPERTVLEAKVIEFGPTPFPIYAGTSAGVRSLTDEFMSQLVNRDGSPVALPMGPEASPQPAGGSRAAPVAYPPVSLDEFVRRLRGDD